MSLQDEGQAFTVMIYESKRAQAHTIDEVNETFLFYDFTTWNGFLKGGNHRFRHFGVSDFQFL